MEIGQERLAPGEVRGLARTLWRGVERTSTKLAERVHSPADPSGATVDADAAASHIIAFNLLAASDHARTLASVIVQPSLGPSAATLARGCLESLARIHWIAKVPDPDEMRARVLAVLYSDVSKGAHSARYAASNRILKRDEYLEEIRAGLVPLDMSMPEWSIGKAIREVVTEAWAGAADWGADGAFDKWTPYSQLSALAHGTLPGLGSLVDKSTGKLGYPSHEVMSGIGIVYGVADRTFHAVGRCPLPILEPDTVDEVWGAIARQLEPDRIRLGREDRGPLAGPGAAAVNWSSGLSE